jgi:hypothetical protein
MFLTPENAAAHLGKDFWRQKTAPHIVAMISDARKWHRTSRQ